MSDRRKTVKRENGSILWGEIEINFLNATSQKDNPTSEKVYFFKFYTLGELTFNKIGTTNKSCLKRLKDELRYYIQHNFTIDRVDVCEIWDCGNTPAESYESFMRALLIKKYPNTWRKNDRFFNTDIPHAIFLALCQQYTAL